MCSVRLTMTKANQLMCVKGCVNRIVLITVLGCINRTDNSAFVKFVGNCSQHQFNLSSKKIEKINPTKQLVFSWYFMRKLQIPNKQNNALRIS